MPIYEYEHLGLACTQGKIFEFRQSLQDQPLTQCPYCKGNVRKVISCPNINTPKTNAELKDLGFTKLVKRDNGVYENVTARQGENRIVHQNRPETFPNLKKTIRD
jgi:putative FmdB family regulatory protein